MAYHGGQRPYYGRHSQRRLQTFDPNLGHNRFSCTNSLQDRNEHLFHPSTEMEMSSLNDNGAPQRPPSRPRAFSTVSSFPSGHFSLGDSRQSNRVEPLPQSLSIPSEVPVDGVASSSGFTHVYPNTQASGPQPEPTHHFITSPTKLAQEVNRDPVYVFNAIKNMTAERQFLRGQVAALQQEVEASKYLRTQNVALQQEVEGLKYLHARNTALLHENQKLQREVDAAQEDCVQILKDYESCYKGFNELCIIKDRKQDIVFTLMDRLNLGHYLVPFGYIPQAMRNAPPVFHGHGAPGGAIPGKFKMGPPPPGMGMGMPMAPAVQMPPVPPPPMGQSADQLRTWREKYPISQSPMKSSLSGESIPEEDSSWRDDSAVKSESKGSSDDGSNDTRLDPSADEFIPTTGSSPESITPKPTPAMRTLGGNAIMFTAEYQPSPTPAGRHNPVSSPHRNQPTRAASTSKNPATPFIPGTYKAYKFIETPGPPPTEADISMKNNLASLPPKLGFNMICPYSLSTEITQCPLGYKCNLQQLCPKFIDPDGKGCTGVTRRDCTYAHEMRSCQGEVKGGVCAFKMGTGNPNGSGRSRNGKGKARENLDTKEEVGAMNGGMGMGGSSWAENAKKHDKARAHRHSVKEAEWKARQTIARLMEAHREGRYGSS